MFSADDSGAEALDSAEDDVGFDDFAEIGGAHFDSVLDETGFLSSESDENSASEESSNAQKRRIHSRLKSKKSEYATTSKDEVDETDEYADSADIEKSEQTKWLLKSRKRKLKDTEDSSEEEEESEEESEERRRRIENEMLQSTSGLSAETIRESNMFREFRVIGLVTNEVPFVVQRMGDSFFIVTCVGKSFHIYEGKKLRLRVSAQTTDGKIHGLCALNEVTFVAVRNRIDVFHRMSKIGSICKHTGRVVKMIVVGGLLITVGMDLRLYVWNFRAMNVHHKHTDPSTILREFGESGLKRMLNEPVKEIDLRGHCEPGDYITTLCHPPTYLNKILIGFRSGNMELWNFNKGKCIYRFQNHLPTQNHSADGEVVGERDAMKIVRGLISSNSKEKRIDDDISDQNKNDEMDLVRLRSAVTCIEASPRLDTVAVGFANGLITVINLKMDKQIMCLQHFNPRVHDGDHDGSVQKATMIRKSSSQSGTNLNLNTDSHSIQIGMISALTFRTDGYPQMCSVGTDGNIVIWNLKTRKVALVYRRAHNERLTNAVFLFDEPLLLTASIDNSLKCWIIEQSDSLSDEFGGVQCRLLRQRTGHEIAPHMVEFHGRRALISTANDSDSLRLSWIQRDLQCQTFGQSARKRVKGKKGGKFRYKQQRKLNRVVAMAVSRSGIRSRFLPNIATAHANDNRVRLWESAKFRLSKDMITPPNRNYSQSNVSALTFSECGQWLFVGRVCGLIDLYSVESCKYQRSFNKHWSSVRSLFVTRLNNILISVGSHDKSVHFWSIKSGRCAFTIPEGMIKDPISTCTFDNRSNVMAVATDGLDILVFNCDDGRMIRSFKRGVYAKSHVTSLVLNSGCQWLLAATMDGSVFVFDLFNQLCVDWFRFDQAVTSMSFSPNNSFLATTHVSTKGIHLWANKSHFETPALRPVGKKPILMDGRPRGILASHLDDSLVISEELLKEDVKREHSEDEEEMKVRVEGSSEMEAWIAKMKEWPSDDDDDYDSSLASDDEFVVQSATLVEVEEQKEWLVSAIARLHLDTEDPTLVTTSGNPAGQWVNLAHWERILERNRPSEKVKHTVKVPFFMASLPKSSLSGTQIALDTTESRDIIEERRALEDEQRKSRDAERRRRILEGIQEKYFDPSSKQHEYLDPNNSELFAKEDGADGDDFTRNIDLSKLVSLLKLSERAREPALSEQIRRDAMEFLLSLPPSAADAEIRSIGLDLEGEQHELSLVLRFFIAELQTNRNFEHLSALVHLFLNVHCTNMVRKYSSLSDLLSQLKSIFEEQWKSVDELFRFNISLAKFFTDYLTV